MTLKPSPLKKQVRRFMSPGAQHQVVNKSVEGSIEGGMRIYPTILNTTNEGKNE